MRNCILMTPLLLLTGCTFSTMEDDRSFLQEDMRHTTTDGGVSRMQVTRQMMVLAQTPEQAQAIATIGDESAGEAEKALATSQGRAAETGIGSVDYTIGWVIASTLGAIGTIFGVKNQVGKSRFVKMIEAFDQKKKVENIVASAASGANGSGGTTTPGSTSGT